jgi:hypothetical protein
MRSKEEELLSENMGDCYFSLSVLSFHFSSIVTHYYDCCLLQQNQNQNQLPVKNLFFQERIQQMVINILGMNRSWSNDLDHPICSTLNLDVQNFKFQKI